MTAPTTSPPRELSSGLVVAGYLFAFFMPIVGVVLGIVSIRRYEGAGTNHGPWMIVVAIASVALYLLLVASAGSSPTYS